MPYIFNNNRILHNLFVLNGHLHITYEEYYKYNLYPIVINLML